MARKFSQSFKIQAVEKALSRSDNSTLKEVAQSLSIGCSTLENWIVKARNQEFETHSPDEINDLTQDKRPQDWTLEERLNMVIRGSTMSEETLSEYCREQGIYPHHVKQWKLDIVSSPEMSKADSRSKVKKLTQENKALKKELNRKDKALAETAALLVLQKKVNEIWGNDEDNSQ